MKEPRRLLEDPEAPLELRRDLQRTAASTASYDVAGGFAALQAALGTADAFGSSTSASPSLRLSSTGAGASGAAASLPVAIKWVLLAAIGGGVAGTAGWLASLPKAPAARPAASAPLAPPAPPAAMSGEPSRAPTVAAPEPVAAPAPVAEATGASGSAPRAGASPSRREIAQLVRIRALLERDPAAAHRAIVAAQREFPAGVLREEREGLDAIALFRSGDVRRARVRAERFVERYPNSPLRPRVERLLTGENP